MKKRYHSRNPVKVVATSQLKRVQEILASEFTLKVAQRSTSGCPMGKATEQPMTEVHWRADAP